MRSAGKPQALCMYDLKIPSDYKSHLTLRQTEVAIKKIKDFFEHDLAIELNLTRVSAPLFVDAASGLNDNLSGVERPVHFDLPGGNELEIKAAVRADTLVRRQFTCPLIVRVNEAPFDEEKIHQMPGLVGVVVQPGDTLWKLAKRFHASVDSIRMMNQLSSDELRVGQRLLIMKQSKL